MKRHRYIIQGANTSTSSNLLNTCNSRTAPQSLLLKVTELALKGAVAVAELARSLNRVSIQGRSSQKAALLLVF
jgi:hypothetical protein